MPHLILEYTENVGQDVLFRELLAQLHQVLADTAGIQIENCKSRALRRDVACIGRGEPQGAFVHLEVRLLAGRSPELKQTIGRQYLDILQGTFGPSPAELRLQITVEIVDMEPGAYFKVPQDNP
jgi:5-carboxymethyl-2-hydroxymuconate isomerase